MTLLDKFRAQPRDKHPDPAVRLAYVEEIPLADRATIAAIAREDNDAAVRKAAVSKLLSPQILGEIASRDADESVRAQAMAMLRDVALDAFEGITEIDSLDAVDAIADGKLLAQIAKSAADEVVALRALSRLVSPAAVEARTFGSIARHAATEAVRRNALGILADGGERGELTTVAMNGEHKDVAVAAVELIGERDELERIASNGRNKAASKRARAILRELQEQEAQQQTTAHTAEDDTTQSTETTVRETTAEITERTDATAVSSEALSGEDSAAPLTVAPVSDEELAQREADERARLEAAEREAADAAAREAAEAEARAAREAEEARAALLRAEEQARRDAERREAREANERARREGLARMHNLLGRVEPLVQKEDLSLKAAERALRDLRAAAGEIPPLPSRQDFEDVSNRLKAAQAAFAEKVRDLRTAAEWRQWANAEIQEELIAKMEALKAATDPEAIASEVRTLQQRWKDAADVPREKADALWRRFKAAHDEVWAKCAGFFAAQAEERARNLASKIALCEKAEALSDSTAWLETAEAIKALQAEWKSIGPVTRGREKQIWDRFRGACDKFFTRRHEDMARRKAVWAENLARKEALIAKAEALAESTDWEAAAAELRKLQNDWKAIGPVKKTRSEAVWQRFRAACDTFFQRYAHRHDVASAERVAAREAICAELDALAAAPPDDSRSPQEILAAVRSLRSKWQHEIAQRGVDPQRARELDERFAAAFAAALGRWPSAFAGSELDPDTNRKKMEALVTKIEQLAASVEGRAAAGADATLSPANRLAAMLKEALAANTIGGKVDDDARWRAAVEDVRQAQAAWSRIGSVPDAMRRPLVDRFQRACRRIMERGGAVRPGGAGRPGGSGRSGRSGRPGGPGEPAR